MATRQIPRLMAGPELRRLRLDACMSQTVFARRLGVAQNVVGNWERRHVPQAFVERVMGVLEEAAEQTIATRARISALADKLAG
jgi:DNA-binding transcriptional regulator YiaG